MDTWETIRLRCRRDGEKIKPVARDLGWHRIPCANTCAKMGRRSERRGYAQDDSIDM
jgi:hypothetical protein